MIVVSAGNKPFRRNLKESQSRIEEFGYTPLIYDLGGLGFGETFEVKDESFQNDGFYHVLKGTKWKTRALHKPDIILDALSRTEPLSTVVYLDGDAFLVKPIDEIDDMPFDVGVTVRREGESEDEPLDSHKKVMGQVNAGVLFFRHTQRTLDFVGKWKSLTQQVGNDQLALCTLLNVNIELPRNGIILIGELNVLTLPTDIYNNYYEEDMSDEIKIIHMKCNSWKDLLL